MNRTITISVIALVAVTMGFSIVAPALADHGVNDIPACKGDTVWDTDNGGCIPAEECPNGVSEDGNPHCALIDEGNDNNGNNGNHANNGKAMGCEKANANSKAAEKNPHCGADLEITGPTEATSKQRTYTVTVTNNGPQTAVNIVVSAENQCDRPAGCVLNNLQVRSLDRNFDGTLESGESADFRVSINANTSRGIASVDSTTNDPNSDNNSLVTEIVKATCTKCAPGPVPSK